MRIASLLSLAFVCSAVAISNAAPYRLAHTFRASAPEENDFFGTAVAIEGGIVAVKSDSGTFHDDDGVSVTHVFEQDSAGDWDETATFEFDSGVDAINPFIGEELAIDGGVIAVGFGDYFDNGTSSAPIQVLSRDTTGWSRSFAFLGFEHPLTPVDQRRFGGRGPRPAGRTVGISGDFIIAEENGAPRPDGSGVGVARVFQRQADDSWAETPSLFTTDSDANGAVAATIDGDTAALVYRSSQSSFPTGGGLYFFERQASGEWIATESFQQDQSEESGFFYRMIDIDGDTAVTRDISTGVLTTYQRLGGVWTESVGPPSTNSVSPFNGGFALEGDLLARTVGGLPEEPALVEVYRREESGDWGLLTTIADPNPEAGLNFGSKIAIDGNRLLVGAISPLSMDSTPAGAAYLFVPVPEPSSTVLATTMGLLALVARRSK